jgi:DNA-binding NtrC family response regulator
MNLLIIDDDDTLRSLLAAELGRFGHSVTPAATAEEGLRLALDTEQDVVLLDLSLPDQGGLDVLRRLRADRPGLEVIVLTAHGTIDSAITALKLGAYDFLQKPCALPVIELAIRRALEHRRLGEENARLKDGLRPTTLSSDLIGSGPEFEELERFISKVAPTDSTVLIRGETGTGKEMVAAAIHRASNRRDHPFVTVDCASLNDNLLQSELFGHERGAFTGAVGMRHGLFESADGGTLFLDEVGDVSPALQASLLRVLETSRFRRVGAAREISVDVRLIAATNRYLERMIAEGQFRQDLFFRLSAIHVELAPLRMRRADVPFLVEHFLARQNARYGTRKRIGSDAMGVLSVYAWPGNVRELRHAVERAAVLADGDVIRARDLPPEVRTRTGTDRPPHPDDSEPLLPLLEVERRYVARVLEYAGGHRARAAALLGIGERTLYRKIQEFHLEDPQPGAGTPGSPGRD